MTLPDFDKLHQALIECKREEQSWGDLFAEIKSSSLSDDNSREEQQFIAASGLVQVLSEWDFYSSPSLDHAANNLGIKSWQITEFVESLRDSLSITESDLVIYERVNAPAPANPSIAGSCCPEPVDDANNHQVYSKALQSLVTAPGKSGLHIGLIVAPSLVAGALAMALLWVLSARQIPPQTSKLSLTQSERGQSFDSPPPAVFDPPRLNLDQWQACKEDESRGAPPPQPGDVWWPVVGPRESLASARQFCRADAFINRSGNVQVASFRDRATAEAFASELTSDSSHSYQFRLGEPSYR